MDGNRSLADGCDICASKIQEFIRQFKLITAEWTNEQCAWYISHDKLAAAHVGAQDETSQTREMGDGVR